MYYALLLDLARLQPSIVCVRNAGRDTIIAELRQGVEVRYARHGGGWERRLTVSVRRTSLCYDEAACGAKRSFLPWWGPVSRADVQEQAGLDLEAVWRELRTLGREQEGRDEEAHSEEIRDALHGLLAHAPAENAPATDAPAEDGDASIKE